MNVILIRKFVLVPPLFAWPYRTKLVVGDRKKSNWIYRTWVMNDSGQAYLCAVCGRVYLCGGKI